MHTIYTDTEEIRFAKKIFSYETAEQKTLICSLFNPAIVHLIHSQKSKNSFPVRTMGAQQNAILSILV